MMRSVKDIALQAFYYILETAGTPNEITCYSGDNEKRWPAASMPISFGRELFVVDPATDVYIGSDDR